LCVVSVTEGDDTVEKQPAIFHDSDLIIINKVDIADAVNADVDKMVADAKKINPDVPVITMSLKEGKGLDEFISEVEKAKAAAEE
jgi:hydrogenase nickel incorporation protein HypB